MTSIQRCLGKLFLLCFFLSNQVLVETAAAQSAGGAQAAQPTFRVIRSVSGSKGSQQSGRFVIEDPRGIFYMPEDKQVMVYFEWEGPMGKHHLEGYCKNPEGKTAVISDFDYESREKRFGGYWILTLTDGTAPGIWNLEARVDGEITGVNSFQIVSATKPADAASNAPKLLSPSDIYKLAMSTTVTLSALTAGGDTLRNGSGFFIADGQILTAFEVIDGATSISVELPDGKRLQTDQVLAWNRWQDWAILKVSSLKIALLNPAKANSWAVGDRCFLLNVARDETRTIEDLNISGTHDYPSAGQRMLLAFMASPKAAGSPLLNEYGEVIGVIAGSTIPGSSSLLQERTGYFSGLVRVRNGPDTVAVPIELVKMPAAVLVASTFAELKQRGQFVPPLIGSELVEQGTLALRLDNRANVTPMALDEKYEFTQKDQQFYVFIMWTPKEKRNTTTKIQIYDLDNNLLSDGKPTKLNMKPSQVAYTSWQLTIRVFRPGTYRIDVTLGDEPAWRTFFSVSE